MLFVELVFFGGMAFLLILFQIMLLTIPFKDKSESEMKEINEATEEWVKSHPFISLCFLFVPPPLVLLFFVTFKPGVKDTREIDYSYLESNVQNPLVQIGREECTTLGKHMS